MEGGRGGKELTYAEGGTLDMLISEGINVDLEGERTMASGIVFSVK